jgi:hypothetical protein
VGKTTLIPAEKVLKEALQEDLEFRKTWEANTSKRKAEREKIRRQIEGRGEKQPGVLLALTSIGQALKKRGVSLGTLVSEGRKIRGELLKEFYNIEEHEEKEA